MSDQKRKRYYFKCPYCQSQILDINYPKHLRKAHSDSEAKDISPPKPAKKLPGSRSSVNSMMGIDPGRSYTLDGYGRVRFLSKGGRRSASSAKKPQTPSTNTSSSQRGLEIVVCPECNVQIETSNWTNHLKNAHSELTTNEPPRSQSTKATPAVKTPLNRSTHTDRANAASRYVSCPECDRKVERDDLDRHINRSHRSPKLSNLYANCPKCRVRVNVKNLEKHLRKIHGQSATSAKSQRAAAEAHRSELLPCKYCNQNIAVEEYLAHLRLKHDKSKPTGRKQSNTTRSTTPKKGQRTTLQKDAFEQDYDEKMDGGKHLGHMRRESGRFGSLPLYDDYDDESFS